MSALDRVVDVVAFMAGLSICIYEAAISSGEPRWVIVFAAVLLMWWPVSGASMPTELKSSYQTKDLRQAYPLLAEDEGNPWFQ